MTTRGFTLLEVLVALVIVGLALGASSRALASLARNSEAMRINSVATWSAENYLINLRLSGAWPALGKSEQDCSQDGLLLSCRQDVQETANPSIRRVEVSVMEAGAPSRSIVRLVQLVPRAQ
jgi:general secretion pathway protein I